MSAPESASGFPRLRVRASATLPTSVAAALSWACPAKAQAAEYTGTTGCRIRPRSKSLAYVLPHLAAADDLFVMTPQAHQLASAFWPGDLAMILPWRDIDLGRQHEPVGLPNALVTLDPGPLGELASEAQFPSQPPL